MELKNRTTLGDLFNAQLGNNFVVGDKLRDVVTEARAKASWADDKVGEDGEMAKVYAEHYSEDLQKLANKVEKALAILVANGQKNNQKNIIEP